MDLLVGLRTCSGSSPYLLPGRYEAGQTMSEGTLNRVITAAVEKAQQQGLVLPQFCVHDLRRTGATVLHEAGFNTDWIEKCLSHEQKGVRAVYNKAEYAEQRRAMLQSWADMPGRLLRNCAVLGEHQHRIRTHEAHAQHWKGLTFARPVAYGFGSSVKTWRLPH